MKTTSTQEVLLVNDKVAAQMLGIGRSTLWLKVKQNAAPAPIVLGGVTRWRVEDLHNFVATLPTTSSERAAA